MVALAPAVAAPAAAQGLKSSVISEIRVEGNQRIEPETVLSYMKVHPGDHFDPQRINDSLKSLFATGLFADVTLRREGGALIVRVVENPIINRLAFEGNKRIDDETLQAEVQLRPRVVYTRTKVQNDVKRILDVYRRSGRFAATVEPKVIQLDQNRVDMVFEIDEGPVTGVRSINFVGNRAFDDSDLRGVIQTKESAFYRIFSTDDTYDPDRLTFDRELLRRFYLNEGYADFRVVSAVAELAPDRKDFFITFTVDEGERYRFGTVDIVTQFPNLDVEPLRGEVDTDEGDWYSAELVEDGIKSLADAVGDLGYAFVDVQPIIDRDRENKVINLTYDIQEGPRVFVERIDIVGNTRTLDKVVRREFRLVEGDAFNAAKVRRSIERVQSLGFFRKVDVTNIPGSEPDRTIIQVEVEEQSTGELSIGAGFSTNEGALGDISIRERNLLGRGLDLRASFRLSQAGTEFDVSYTDPYFLDKNLSFGVDAFRITRDKQEESSYDLQAIGGGLRIGYEITEHLRHTFRYTLRQDDVRDVSSDASRFIKEQEGKNVTSLVGQTLTYDRRDNRLFPTEGYYISLTNEFAGIGGDVQYIRNKVNGGAFWPILDDWVFSLTGEAGIMDGLGQRVRVNDRFFLGGDSFRGFETAGIGPRDRITEDSLGGNQYYRGTAELSFPLFGVPEELGVTGKMFTDVGTLGVTDDKGEEIQDTRSLRASVGVGIGWISPFGPIRVDLAQAILKEEFDKTQLLHFSFGARF